MRSLILNRLAIAALALSAACSGACASSGYSPKPFPIPGGPPSLHPAPSHPPPAAAEAPSQPAPGAGDTSSHAAPADAPGAAGTWRVDSYAIVGTALALRGTPYRNGGADPKGFDCSGFTQYVFSQYGLALPRAVREQYRAGKAIATEELAPGDILFFSTTAPGPSHVAIAIGGDQFVHAPSSTGVVRVEHLGSSYWSPRYLGARRVLN